MKKQKRMPFTCLIIWFHPFCPLNVLKSLCHAAPTYSANCSSDQAFMLDAFSTDLTPVGEKQLSCTMGNICSSFHEFITLFGTWSVQYGFAF
ncbi:hypothetical protein GQ55_8G104500 [Panicum hallii var. hallii]|uniref:Secreted protein n=1 Tax=Panicum hallii var. hallii TaxID=1504633 RepID=A0A2T7CMC6_9POAL|nr:hypothetical protein GQ55_8G104500 [Panicum hallii var. hallii]